MIIIIICILLLLVYLYTSNIEFFVSYKKCDNKPVRGITKEIFDKYDITKAENDEPWDFYIPCGYNGIEKELKHLEDLEEKQKIFGIDGCDRIVSKNSLWNILLGEYGFEKASEIMPSTYDLNKHEQMVQFEKDYKKGNIYILKRNVQRKKGIKLSDDYFTITNAKYHNYKLVQEFKQSYLVNNRKLNIRVYMLIVAQNDSIEVYIHKLNKILYASKKTSKNKLDFDSNITNSYNVERDIYKTHPYNVQELEELTNNISIQKQINEKMRLLSRAIVLPLNKIPGIKKNKKFQLFGVDILYDTQGNSYILEINKGPDMIPKDERDKQMKTKVISDSLSKLDLIPDDNYNGFELVYKM
jgi:hypothetical protein